MENKEIPPHVEGNSESLYAGFWPRLGSSLLDFVFTIPVILLIQYLNGLGIDVYYYTCVPALIFGLWYYIYIPKKYGGTPGKLVTGIAIIRLDGEPIGWKEAILRHSVLGVLTLAGIVIMIIALRKADDTTFMSYNWLQQSQYLVSLSPTSFNIYTWTTNIWVYGEFIVLLTNKRRRAVHDFIAGTVIVRKKYLAGIGQDINSEIAGIGSTKGI